MSNELVNPYEFLNVPENITIEDLKEHSIHLLKMHHPDKGGNREYYEKLKSAIVEIKNNIKTGKKFQSLPKLHNELKNSSVIETNFIKPADFLENNMTSEQFNKKFQEAIKNNAIDKNFLIMKDLNNANDNRINRNKTELLNEFAKQDEELKVVPKLMANFDPNVFNNLYLELNKQPETGLRTYKEPQSLSLGDNKLYTQINDFAPVESESSNINDFYSGKNHSQLPSTDILNQYKGNNVTNTSDITDSDRALMKQKMSEYKVFSNTKIEYDSNFLPPTEVITKDSNSNSINADLNKKLAERSMINVQNQLNNKTSKAEINFNKINNNNNNSNNQQEYQNINNPSQVNPNKFKLNLNNMKEQSTKVSINFNKK